MDKTSELLEKLADKLGIAVNKLSEITIDETIFKAWRNLVETPLITGTIIALILLFARKGTSKLDKEPDYGRAFSDYNIAWAIIWFGVALFTLIAYDSIIDNIRIISNPEFYAIKSLFE